MLQPRELFSYTRELFIRARDLSISVREPVILAGDQDIVGFKYFRVRRGTHWCALSHPMSRKGGGRISTNSTKRQTLIAVLTKAWPHDGKYVAAYADPPSVIRHRDVRGMSALPA